MRCEKNKFDHTYSMHAIQLINSHQKADVIIRNKIHK